MSLLDQKQLDKLIGIARAKSNRAVEQVRAIMYADGPHSVPPGFDNLDTPDKVRTFTRYLSRQSEREQRKATAGNLAQATAANPSVQQMAMDAGAGTTAPTPDGSVMHSATS